MVWSSTSATRLELIELADWRTDTELRADDELSSLVAVAGAVSLLGLTPLDERCDGVGIAVDLNVELDVVSPVLLHDDDDLTSLMHVAAAAVDDNADGRLTRALLADVRFTSDVSIDSA